jgi:glycosyltransferase involved in cell wall biosynthesis
MRIGIDIRKYRDFGIGTYIRNLISECDRLPEYEWIYFASRELIQELSGSWRGRLVENRSPRYSPGELLSMARLAHAAGCDLFHSPHYTFPFGLRCKGVVTIHDLIHLRVPGALSGAKRAYARFLIEHACTAADRVIVDSEHTRQDLLSEFKVPERNVRVVHLGVSPQFKPAVAPVPRGGHGEPGPDGHSTDRMQPEAPASADLLRLGVRRPYLLYSGALKPHKNLPVLMRAFAQIAREFDLQLVLSGESIQARPELVNLAGTLRVRDRIVSTGRRPEADVVTLNQHASAAVLPSLYEGFGLPVLEAMACGVPVVAARATSIPEVAGDAGVLFDPHEPDDLASALRRVLSDEHLQSDLRKKGLIRSAEFTWGRCVQKTLEVYAGAFEG